MKIFIKKHYKTIIKILFTTLGLYLAYSQVDVSLLSKDFTNYNWWILVLCVVLNVLNVFTVSYRLFLVVNRKAPWKDIVKSNFIAVFLNLFLPSTIGGDIAKVAKLNESSKSLGKSTVSVVIDRFYGIISLVILSIIFSVYIYFFDNTTFPNYINIFVLVFSILVIIAWVLIMNINLDFLSKRTFKINIFNIKKEFSLRKPLEAISELRETSKRDRVLMIILSIIYHSISSLIAFLGIKFLSLQIPITYVIIFRTISTLLLMLPLSIGGLGIRDIIYKELYGQVTTSKQIFLLAPFTFIVLVITGIIGGIILIFDKKKD